MLLKNDTLGRNALQDTVLDYYESKDRHVRLFHESGVADGSWMRLDFLVDRLRVIRYEIGNDPNPQGDRWVGGILLAIGPHFFAAADFWSYPASERFRLAADVEAVVHNLKMMDEFWNAQSQLGIA